jgi:hypothetical protein
MIPIVALTVGGLFVLYLLMALVPEWRTDWRRALKNVAILVGGIGIGLLFWFFVLAQVFA